MGATLSALLRGLPRGPSPSSQAAVEGSTGEGRGHSHPVLSPLGLVHGLLGHEASAVVADGKGHGAGSTHLTTSLRLNGLPLSRGCSVPHTRTPGHRNEAAAAHLSLPSGPPSHSPAENTPSCQPKGRLSSGRLLSGTDQCGRGRCWRAPGPHRPAQARLAHSAHFLPPRQRIRKGRGFVHVRTDPLARSSSLSSRRSSWRDALGW